MLSEKEIEFLRELTALTRKHGIAVGGCGCCGSPYLLTGIDVDVSDPRSGYSMASGELRWIEPGDAFDWERYSAGIVKEDT